ncbi:MAG: hypothetical protein AMJ72_05265 [Acidithiobacillales bacterium SM1_46]|nr:MAG: hypothetical protein AMJ72_05265 [Acidithiobacillales bacterium SM1_46]
MRLDRWVWQVQVLADSLIVVAPFRRRAKVGKQVEAPCEADQRLRFLAVTPRIEAEVRWIAPKIEEQPCDSLYAATFVERIVLDVGANDRLRIRQGLWGRYQRAALVRMAAQKLLEHLEGNHAIAVARKDGEQHGASASQLFGGYRRAARSRSSQTTVGEPRPHVDQADTDVLDCTVPTKS